MHYEESIYYDGSIKLLMITVKTQGVKFRKEP